MMLRTSFILWKWTGKNNFIFWIWSRHCQRKNPIRCDTWSASGCKICLVIICFLLHLETRSWLRKHSFQPNVALVIIIQYIIAIGLISFLIAEDKTHKKMPKILLLIFFFWCKNPKLAGSSTSGCWTGLSDPSFGWVRPSPRTNF